MAAAPAAKMAKQEDYTLTRRDEFNRFLVALLAGGNHYFPHKRIDGVEVITKVGIIVQNNQLLLEMFAWRDCRNGLMFHKGCGRFYYEMFQKSFFSANENDLMDIHVGFNKLMAFMVEEVPHMKIYGNKLVMAIDFDAMTAQEETRYAANPHQDRCGQCSQINDGTLMTLIANMHDPQPGACLKCYLRDRYTQFDTDVENHVLVYDHDKFEFDVGGSCKFAERIEGGLISMDMYNCRCHDEDDEDDDDDDDDDDDYVDDYDDDDEDPPAYNGPPPVIHENAEAARAA